MRARRHAVSTLIATALAIALFVSPGSAADTQEVANVDRTAYFTRPITTVTPPLLINGFPPSTACLVAGLAGVPEVCGPEVADLVDALGLGGGLPVPETIDADLAQPVLPGTLPVGMLGGQERYSSLLRFSLPTLPDGQEFGTFELLLHPDGLSFAIESPAFRQAVLAAISQIDEPSADPFVEVLSDVLSGETAAIAQTITGIEACPATEGWDGNSAQNAGTDGRRLPDVDCLIGTTGAFDASINAWVFDLTFAAQAWTTGGLAGEPIPNEGILFRPLGAENLAYGDPDLSTNWLLSLADETNANADLHPRIRYTIVPSLSPIEPAPDLGTPIPPPATPAGPSLQPIPSAGPTPAPPAPVAANGQIRARWVEPASVAGDPRTPWWVILIIPVGLAGAWALGEGLFAGPALSTRRDGALQHLVQNDPHSGAP